MRRNMIIAFTAASLWGGALAQPLAADPTECYESVLTMCAEWMEDANFFQRIAIGVFCSGMLAGCTGDAVLDGLVTIN